MLKKIGSPPLLVFLVLAAFSIFPYFVLVSKPGVCGYKVFTNHSSMPYHCKTPPIKNDDGLFQCMDHKNNSVRINGVISVVEGCWR